MEGPFTSEETALLRLQANLHSSLLKNEMYKTYIKLIRPSQWIKNLLLLFPPFFAGSMSSPSFTEKVIPALLAFCAAASSTYIINDIKDVEADRNHNTKKNRAIAKGDITVSTAMFIAVIFFFSATYLSLLVSSKFWLYIVAYLLISLSYTFLFKDKVILDIFVISLGFLVRVLAGGEAFGVPVSNWLFMTVFMVSLFLATGKRIGEMVFLGDDAHTHRKSLSSYSSSFLEGILWFSASSALVMYSLYTLEHRSRLFYTVPIAAFGLLRYIYIAKEGKGDPTEALLGDRQVMVVGIVWLLVICLITYT